MTEGNNNLTFVGKIRTIQGRNGEFNKISFDNPEPLKPDGTADGYHKGFMAWYDVATDKWYKVKNIQMHRVSEQDAARGAVNSLAIDLVGEYDVKPL